MADDTPQAILDVADSGILAFEPKHFSIDATGMDCADCLLAALKDQAPFADFTDEHGAQSAVRIDLIDGKYWVSAKSGTQSDVEAAVSNYDAKKAEMYPDA